MNLKYSVVIPSYRNLNTVYLVVYEVVKLGYCALVINDGEDSSIFEHALSDLLNHELVTVLHNTKNMGKGATLKRGFEQCKKLGFTHAVTIDSDGQHDPKNIEHLVEVSHVNPDTIVIGRRDFASSKHPVPKSSVFGRSFSDFWVRLETGQTVEDSQSGFRCYPLHKFDYGSIAKNRYDFEVAVIVKWLWAGLSLNYQTIGVQYPEARVSSFHKFYDNLRLTLLHTKLCTLRLLQLHRLSMRLQQRPIDKEVGGVDFLQVLIRFFGTRLCYGLLPLVVFFYFIFYSNARRNLGTFYSAGFGKSRFKSFWCSYKNLVMFSLSILDRLAFSMGLQRPDVFYRGIIDQKITRSQTLVGGHFGDWMFAGYFFSKTVQRPLFILMNHLPSRNFLTKITAAFSDGVQFGDLSEDSLQALLSAKGCLESGGFVGVMGDRPSVRPQWSLPQHFLGFHQSFDLKVFKMILALKAPAGFFASTRLGLGRRASYEVFYNEIWDGSESLSPEDLCRRYVDALQGVTQRYPASWFNFGYQWSEGSTVLESSNSGLLNQVALGN